MKLKHPVIFGCCLVTGCMLLATISLCILVGLGVFTYGVWSSTSEPQPPTMESETRHPATPEAQSTPQEHPTQETADRENLSILEKTIIPERDPIALAERLENKSNIPLTIPLHEPPYQTGDQELFWIMNLDNEEYYQIHASLQYSTEHLYLWIEDEIRFDGSDLKNLAETFEQSIYPTTRAFFGSEWTPGIDNDPHIYVLYAKNLGDSIAGYFSSNDEIPPEAHKYSNSHEMFLFNADTVRLEEDFTYGVLAHEFQHMIHWFQDRNEETWVDEGFSELAAFLNGYDQGYGDEQYALQPDQQLTFWPADIEDSTPYYGASFLFLNYFLGRFGESVTQKLISEEENGLEGFDLVLKTVQAQDPITEKAIQADDVFLDWVVASFLNDPSIENGKYSYRLYPDAPTARTTKWIKDCSPIDRSGDVHQYGVDYISIKCAGSYTLNFQAADSVKIFPADPHSGGYVYWSNRGNESDMTLTKEFDFQKSTQPFTLTYWTWFDIEKDYDYVYVEASLDGESWQILNTPSGTDVDPSGNSYGWGYNHVSGGGPEWIQETIDLSQFAGEKSVTLRFEYITDAGVNGEGFLLDDLSIPAIGYFTDFENDDGGWVADGFVRVKNLLPQTYQLAVIKKGDKTTIEKIGQLDANFVSIPLTFDKTVSEIILVVSGTSRFTNLVAPYHFTINSR